MSPEQAQGKSADERSDLFSFGVVLYEMISGQAPFTGGTLLQLLFAVINGEPEPVSELRFDLPKERGELDRIIKRMLAKNPNDRYQKSSELRDDLLKLKRRLEDRKRSLSAPAWRWAALLGAALIIFLIVRDFQQRRAATLRANNPVVNVRSDQRITSLIDRENWAGGGIRRFSVSTDGKWLAYDMGEESGSAIWIKSLDGAAELQITDGRRRDRDPIWSLDGKSLAFSSDREGRSAIWQIDVGDMLGRQAERPAGGQAGENKPAPEALVEIDLGDARLINWSRDGKAIYYESRGDLMALDATTGQSSKLTNFASANQRVNGFSVSPDEKFLAYEQADSPGGQTHLFVSSLGGDQPRQISFGEGNDQSPNWFPDGRTIAYRSNRSGRYQIYLVEMRDLETRRITSSESHYEFFTVSPDGEKIVYLFQKETGNISICDIQTKRETEQTSDGKLNRWPEISADGEWLAYQTLEANVSSVNEAITVRSLAVGGGSRKVQLAGFEARWSPAAAMIGFLRRQGAENGGRIDIYRYDLNDLQLDQSSAGSNGQLVAGEVVISGSTLLPFNRLAASYTWSPNGREIAYSAVKDGRSSILKSSIGDQQPVELVIVAAANQLQSLKSPCWSPGGERIAYLIEERSGERQQSLWVNEQGKNVELYTGRERLRLVGWSETGREIYLALGEPKSSHLAVQPLRLIKVDVDSRRAAPLVVLPAAYLHNFSLSRDGRQIAFISRPENHDDIYLYSISQSRFKKLTDNREPRLYYAGLSWAPDGKQLCYGKQGSKSEVWMIEKFR